MNDAKQHDALNFPMPPAQPSATPAPIHDIVDVLPIFPYPWWMIALAAVGVFCILGWAVWFFFLRRKPAPPLSPRARAVAALLQIQSEQFAPYEFGVRISDILRRYVDEAYGIRAVSATSLEFLESIRDNPRFSDAERASLREFLEAVDLIKFARVEPGGTELQSLFTAAEAVVRKADEEAVS